MMLKVVQYGIGISLILLGIAGLFLPFLQGILMIVLGIVVLRAHKAGDVWLTIKEKVVRAKRKG
ncbi:hypothetical protein KY359_04220 [Candidatus Woesearchaeota archaeon]|nr:hypothetical protein [Candidatus Woesearchaeota archaeon]